MRDDALPAGRLLAAAAAIVLVVATAIVVVLAMLRTHGLPRGGEPVAPPARLGAGLPALEVAPQPELAAYRRAQAAAQGDDVASDAAAAGAAR
jgi:hypothetical protein